MPNKKTLIILFVLFVLVFSTALLGFKSLRTVSDELVPEARLPSPIITESATTILAEPTVTPKMFSDSFNLNEIITEKSKPSLSTSKNWWLNSGAYLYIENDVASTVKNELKADDERRKKYLSSNPQETDDGYHPQNIFRLLTRSQWLNFQQEIFFKINRYISSADSHRQASNGVLLFNRYLDEDNLYYAGLRVDGSVVIKKKLYGKYYTLALKNILKGKYDRNSNPNVIELNKWIGLRTIVSNDLQGNVKIKLFVNYNQQNWNLELETVDKGANIGNVINSYGNGGIRTDFMDVEFDNYKIQEM